MIERDLKRGSTEMLIMAMVEDQPRHGYEMGKLMEPRSRRVRQFHIASLYPLLPAGETRVNQGPLGRKIWRTSATVLCADSQGAHDPRGTAPHLERLLHRVRPGGRINPA